MCVSPDGQLYVCSQGCIRVYSSTGVEQHRLDVGLSDVRWVVSATSEGSRYVIAASKNGELQALDPESGRLRWAVPSPSSSCAGLAVLSRSGLLICGMRGSETLFAYSLRDGSVVGSCRVRLEDWIAADASTDSVFCNVLRENRPDGQLRVVERATWSNGSFSSFAPVWSTLAASSSAGWPLAVVPRSRSATAAHLVVVHQPGFVRRHNYRIVCLADISEVELPHPDESLDDYDMMGIAADEFGDVVVVWDRDASRPSVHVLAWPL